MHRFPYRCWIHRQRIFENLTNVGIIVWGMAPSSKNPQKLGKRVDDSWSLEPSRWAPRVPKDVESLEDLVILQTKPGNLQTELGKPGDPQGSPGFQVFVWGCLSFLFRIIRFSKFSKCPGDSWSLASWRWYQRVFKNLENLENRTIVENEIRNPESEPKNSAILQGRQVSYVLFEGFYCLMSRISRFYMLSVSLSTLTIWRHAAEFQ